MTDSFNVRFFCKKCRAERLGKIVKVVQKPLYIKYKFLCQHGHYVSKFYFKHQK